MTLKKYIEKYGAEHLAQLLDVTERRVKSWYYGERIPRPKVAQQIEKVTNKKVRVRECY